MVAVEQNPFSRWQFYFRKGNEVYQKILKITEHLRFKQAAP